MHVCFRLDVIKLDVNSETDIQAASQYVGNKYAKLDLLVNSAGMLHPAGRGETSLKDVTSQVELLPLALNSVTKRQSTIFRLFLYTTCISKQYRQI